MSTYSLHYQPGRRYRAHVAHVPQGVFQTSGEGDGAAIATDGFVAVMHSRNGLFGGGGGKTVIAEFGGCAGHV